MFEKLLKSFQLTEILKACCSQAHLIYQNSNSAARRPAQAAEATLGILATSTLK